MDELSLHRDRAQMEEAQEGVGRQRVFDPAAESVAGANVVLAADVGGDAGAGDRGRREVPDAAVREAASPV
jgi:hypothetical protein